MTEDKIPMQELFIKDRRQAEVSGVKNILGFSEEYVSLETSAGNLVIEGSKMKIESLTRDNATVIVNGHISSAYYSEQKSKKSLFARLFE